MEKQFLKYITLLALVFAFGIQNASAYNFWLTVQGEVSFNNQPLDGATITVFKNGEKERTFHSNKKGKIVYTFHDNAHYEIRVQKEGFITKIVDFDTTIPNWYQGAYAYWFDMDMVKMPIQKMNPVKVGKIEYNETANSFKNDWNFTYMAHAKIIGQTESTPKIL